MSSGGLTRSPMKITTAISTMRRPTPVASTTSAPTSAEPGWVFPVTLMSVTLPARAADLVGVGPWSHAQSAGGATTRRPAPDPTHATGPQLYRVAGDQYIPLEFADAAPR